MKRQRHTTQVCGLWDNGIKVEVGNISETFEGKAGRSDLSARTLLPADKQPEPLHSLHVILPFKPVALYDRHSTQWLIPVALSFIPMHLFLSITRLHRVFAKLNL